MFSGFLVPDLPVSFPPSLRLASLVFLLTSFFFSFFSINYGQVKIKEKVEIKPSGSSVITEKLSKTTNNLMNIRAELSYNSQSFDIGGMWGPKFAHVICSAFFIQRVGGSQPLAEARMQEGNIVLTATTERPSPNGYVEILVNGGFTALSEDGGTTGIPSPYCCSGADVKVDVYIDGVLQSKNHRSDAYDGFAVINPIYPPKCGDGVPECDGEQNVPILKPIEKPLDIKFCENNNNKYGYTETKIDSDVTLFENQKLVLCIKNNQWQFTIGNQNELKTKTKIGLCIDNIKDNFEHLIYDINDIDNIPESEICDALKDFKIIKDPLRYDVAKSYYGAKYMILEVIAKHEVVHLEDHKNILNNAFNEIKNDFLDINLRCDEGYDYQKALEEFRRHNLEIRNNMREMIIELLDDKPSSYYNETCDCWYNYEQNTQANLFVQEIINIYINKLEDRARVLNIKCR